MPTDASCTLPTARSMRARMALASTRKVCPAGVRATGRLWRSNSCTCRACSSARICWVMAVWVMKCAAAARVKDRPSATETK